MAKLEIDSDLCSFLYNTKVPVTANVYRQDNLTKLLVGYHGSLECRKFIVLGAAKAIM